MMGQQSLSVPTAGNLPQPSASFIGREVELEAIARRASDPAPSLVLVLAIVLGPSCLATSAASDPSLERSRQASSRRWVRLGNAYEEAQAESAGMAMTQRYQALATYYAGSEDSAVDGPDVDTARWSKLGEVYQAARAEAAAATMTKRYQAMAQWYSERGLIATAAEPSFVQDVTDSIWARNPTRAPTAPGGGYSGDDDYDPAAGGSPPVLGR